MSANFRPKLLFLINFGIGVLTSDSFFGEKSRFSNLNRFWSFSIQIGFSFSMFFNQVLIFLFLFHGK